VTTTADNSADDGQCSLREAITTSLTNLPVGPVGGNDCTQGTTSPDDHIQLQAATYLISGTGDDSNVTGDFDISFAGGTEGFMFIDGTAGPNDEPLSTIDAANNDRIFDILSGGSPTLSIQHVVLQNGNVTGSGGAIRVGDDDTELNLNESKIVDSDATANGGGLFGAKAGGGDDVHSARTPV